MDSLGRDSLPRFPLPSDLVSHFTNGHRYSRLDDIIATWTKRFPHSASFAEVMSHIANMAEHINDTPRNMLTSLWYDEWFMLRRFEPIVYEALSLPRRALNQPDSEPEIVVSEAVRLTCLILLSSMSKKFGMGASADTVSVYQKKAVNLLVEFPIDWFSFLELRLWILVIGGLFTEGEMRTWYISEISSTMDRLGLDTWEATHSIVKGMIWVDDLLDNDATKFGNVIEQFIRQNSSSLL